LYYVPSFGTFKIKKEKMIQLSVNKFRANLKSFVDQALNDHIPLRVQRRTGRDFIVISAEDWEREQETLHVLQNSSLMRQIGESLKTHGSNKGYKPSKEELHEINNF
jgi:antitoxin YefM